MGKNKIKSLTELTSLVSKLKKKGKTVGLITGCFDVLHIGHIDLFQKAKECVDVVIVGVENDETIRRAKGKDRPINNQGTRLRFLSVIDCVDYIFLVEDVFSYSDDRTATRIHDKILRTIKPNYVLTHKDSDKYWRNKEKRAQKLGIKLLDVGVKLNSTTKIVEHLLSEL
ncbi:pantoate--beta-alanine ligase [candidate division WWE3 bacterium]|nr:pantoate--beta-alanine ligase [candidate division WWE3 bacterium]